MKTKTKLLTLLLVVATLTFISCGKHDPYALDGINWDGDNGGTLELQNNTSKDMVLFIGQTPGASSMIGGVRSGANRKYDISRHVDDFAVGGYSILRGVTKEEYDKNIDLTKAKVEFTAMVTYRANASYRYTIDPNFIGDYGFRAENNSPTGIELRKDSPEGEKVAYLAPSQRNQMVYASSTDIMTLFPVFVVYNNTSKEITTIKSTSMAASVSVAASPLSDPKLITTIQFPDEGLTWESIVGDLKSPVAYISFTNNVLNQAVYFTNAGSLRYFSQDGFNGINPGITKVFEIEGGEPNENGELGITAEKNLVVLVRGTVKVPVLFEGQRTSPRIENGYNYTATVKFNGGDVMDASNYQAYIEKGAKRKVNFGDM